MTKDDIIIKETIVNDNDIELSARFEIRLNEIIPNEFSEFKNEIKEKLKYELWQHYLEFTNHPINKQKFEEMKHILKEIKNFIFINHSTNLYKKITDILEENNVKNPIR
jgi:hypothetical protein